ncbi:hypothetical protein BJX96DRAFT_141802 [Aspergillus floccosus]
MPSASEDGSKVASIIACNTIMLSLASFGACVRVSAQIYERRFDADDGFFLLSWVFAFVLCFTSMWMTRYGLGRHFTLIEGDMDKITTFFKLDYVTGISYLVSLTSIKLSFCLLYLKVFSITRLRWLYYLVMVFLVCEFIEEIFVFTLQCSPPSKFFYPTKPGTCMDLYVFYHVAFAIRLVTDIALFLLPIPQLLKLHTSTWIKAGLLVMFGLGLLVCVTSIIRITYIRHFQRDFTWLLVDALNWSSVEICTAILIASIPSFRKLIRRICRVWRKFVLLQTTTNHSTQVSPHEEDHFAAAVVQRRSGTPDNIPLPSPVLEPCNSVPMTGNAGPAISDDPFVTPGTGELSASDR